VQVSTIRGVILSSWVLTPGHHMTVKSPLTLKIMNIPGQVEAVGELVAKRAVEATQ